MGRASCATIQLPAAIDAPVACRPRLQQLSTASAAAAAAARGAAPRAHGAAAIASQDSKRGRATSMEASDSMELDDDATALPAADAAAAVLAGAATQVSDAGTSAEEAVLIATDLPGPVSPSAAGLPKARRGARGGEFATKLAHEKFYNAFEDDFDERDMRLSSGGSEGVAAGASAAAGEAAAGAGPSSSQAAAASHQ